MLVDDYDYPVFLFDETFHFYKNDTSELIDETIEKILFRYTTNNEIVINHRKYSQHEENQEFVQEIKKVIKKLRTHLQNLNTRTFVSVGGKVLHRIVHPEVDDYRINVYLVQFYNIHRPL
jgi:hypothetical protein